MRTSLVIMAAGIGSRFGGGIKQLEPVGLNDEIIMDYSIHDAIEAGFNKVVFIIRKDIEADFRERIGDRVEAICEKQGVEVAYAFQALQDIPAGFEVPADRTKPWGTGQAVLAAKDVIKEPFVVINADDYYGKECFVKLHDYLVQPHASNEYCMAGFILKNTLSENGAVTRGVCKATADGMLADIVETSNIVKLNSIVKADEANASSDEIGAAINDPELDGAVIVGEGTDGEEVVGQLIDADSYVSMNMWGFPGVEGETPEYVKILESDFVKFFETKVPAKPLKAEYLLPIHIGDLLAENKISVDILETTDRWFGVTYKEDKDYVVESFKQLIADGVYAKDLYSDL